MNNLIKIEKAIKEDILQILDIYNYYINFGLANFEEEEMSYDGFFELYSSIIKLDLPFLVAKKDNKIDPALKKIQPMMPSLLDQG